MPSKGTARRAVRVDDDLWAAALAKAAAEGTDVSAVIRTALTRYVAKAPRKPRPAATKAAPLAITGASVVAMAKAAKTRSKAGA